MTSTVYKTAIIGGGASGILSAVELTRGENALKGNEVVILERLNRIGKKLIATGNGQGNLTNDNLSFENYYGDKGFLRAFFSDAPDISEYLYNIGIPLTTESDGKKYPISKQASAVLDMLMSILNSTGVEIKTEFFVKSIKKQGDIFVIDNGLEKVRAQNVILAFGGKAGKQFGTDGSSYSIAKNFGHSLTTLYPSLVQLKTNLSNIKGLKGIKEQARVYAYESGKLLKTTLGEVLFTEYGVSGNAIFYISPAVVDKSKANLVLEFLPDITQNDLEKIIKDKIKNLPHLSAEEVLSGIVNKRIAKIISQKVIEIRADKLAYEIKNFNLEITGSLGFDYAQVTKGGIDTDKVNPFTMKSKCEKGVYLVGESLNVDGDCGGYNLTFAFLSGIKAAKAIKENC